LAKADAECKSNDKKLGWQIKSVDDCVAKAEAEGGKFFILGKGKKAGRCYVEYTTSATCPEGWEDDFYDFYEFNSQGVAPSDFALAPELAGTKCKHEGNNNHPDRTFRKEPATVEECESACTADPECMFFTVQSDVGGWCIGCKIEPAESHKGAITYRRQIGTTTLAGAVASSSASGPAVQISVSFRASGSDGHLADEGKEFSPRDGFDFGWMCDGTPIDQTSGVQKWGIEFDGRSLCKGTTSWDIAVPSGSYRINALFPKNKHECKVQDNKRRRARWQVHLRCAGRGDER
jgi:hypothetical protein